MEVGEVRWVVEIIGLRRAHVCMLRWRGVVKRSRRSGRRNVRGSIVVAGAKGWAFEGVVVLQAVVGGAIEVEVGDDEVQLTIKLGHFLCQDRPTKKRVTGRSLSQQVSDSDVAHK
jgi:hypothetical protein